ncbi:hypothetical protein [Streptomyces kanamyceticus]|uniref:Uncharacterized protein n=1 Tax=Streptomyces kanamyceticus TaxID=1967 RepID=A0A5J6GH08_STRKN|nr:hypothetical protein [Streptomyces kanamyceticus]QEU94769.1 hypothetical protein CP970_31240 [Streptomyces kanamyceticus]
MARTRSRTGYGQLLLLAALLLGIVTMHTLGHPSGGHDGHDGHDGGASMPAAASAPMSPSMGHEMAGAAPTAPTARVVAPASEPHHGMSMDPLSVCLAVLGAFTLIVLVRAGLLRPGGTRTPLPSPGRLLPAPRPDPPPPRIRLARLSVLRI